MKRIVLGDGRLKIIDTFRIAQMMVQSWSTFRATTKSKLGIWLRTEVTKMIIPIRVKSQSDVNLAGLEKYRNLSDARIIRDQSRLNSDTRQQLCEVKQKFSFWFYEWEWSNNTICGNIGNIGSGNSP